MSQGHDDIRRRVLGWYAKAEQDFVLASAGLSGDVPSPAPISFLSQQCAEKHFKAFLTRHQVEFPKTHNMATLLALIESIDAGLAECLGEAKKLTPYGVDIRYPDDFPETSLALAKEALEIASNVRSAVREALRTGSARRKMEPTGKAPRERREDQGAAARLTSCVSRANLPW